MNGGEKMAEKVEDLNLPMTVVSRIVKESLPPGAAITKEARTGLAKVASVFVLYVTSASAIVAKKAGRRTLSGQDVLDAMEDIEFEKFIEPLKESLEIYRSNISKKKQSMAKKKSDGTADVQMEAISESAEIIIESDN